MTDRFSRPQILERLTKDPKATFEASLRSYAAYAVSTLVQGNRLHPTHAEAAHAWMVQRLLAYFHLHQASEIAEENKLDENQLADALEEVAEKLSSS